MFWEGGMNPEETHTKPGKAHINNIIEDWSSDPDQTLVVQIISSGFLLPFLGTLAV